MTRNAGEQPILVSVEELLGEGQAKSGANGVPFTYATFADTRLRDVTFYLHDHLGNTRVTYKVGCDGNNGTGHLRTLEHAVDYYPYGSILREFVNGQQEKYLTTHHERDGETGLDYRGARYYDSDVARFLSLDPLAADYASWSPYNYVMGNPISLVDPDGRSPDCGCPNPPCPDDDKASMPSAKNLGLLGTATGVTDGTSSKPPAISIASGGISGLTLDVTFGVNGVKADGLQVIQTFHGTRSSTLGQAGTYTWTGSNGVTMDGFVDGGANSPYVLKQGNAPAHPTEPYYLTSGEVSRQVTWSGSRGSVEVYDMPLAVREHSVARFETAIIATNYKGSGSDTLLGSFSWGWNAGGTPAVHSGISLLPKSSATFDSIVKHDYPSYRLLKP